MTKTFLSRAVCGVSLLMAAGLAPSATAQEAGGDDAVTWGFVYKGDISGTVSGADNTAGRYLDNIEITGEASLGRLFGWTGGRVYGHLLSNTGGMPNDLAGTLQGVGNIEVARPRAKLYQLWFEQAFGDQASVLAGLYDLNSEFYQTDAASLLIAPAFGIGSELAATGPNGPSIFPSTALALRGRWNFSDSQSIQGAVLNASAGVIGDPGGVDLSFDEGALLIGEWVHAGDAQVRIGAWRYTDKQDDIRALDGFGAPVLRTAQGIYASVEGSLWEGDVRTVAGFLRAGAADGDTTPFLGGWQAGVLAGPVFASRPDSQFSFGVNQGLVNDKHQANAFDLGQSPADSESAIEITYADKIGDHLTLQPDLQLIHNPDADEGRDAVVIATLRATLEY